MRRFIEAVRENNRLRQKVEAALVGNMQDFVMAKSLESDLMVEEIFAVPTREVMLHIEEENVMSVRVPSSMPVLIIHTEMMKGTWFIATSPLTVKWTAPSKKWGIYSLICSS